MNRKLRVWVCFALGLFLCSCVLGMTPTEQIVGATSSPQVPSSVATTIQPVQPTPIPAENPDPDPVDTPGSNPAPVADQENGICSQRITIEIDGILMRIPYCRNYALGKANAAIERAVVVIHGTNRTAGNYFNYVANALARAGGRDTQTLLLAPQFLIEADLENNDLEDDLLFWSDGGWKRGDQSQTTHQNPRPVQISSFGVLDIILEKLADREKFPNLADIVIVGHSAGGQFVNRYAAGGQMPARLAQQNNFDMRYIVANPSSYLYFNNVRRVEGTLDQFSVPDTANCPAYNEYKYGVEDRNNYMSSVGEAQLEHQYKEREVIYLLGADDNDPNSPDLDQSCAAMLQGSNRLERGLIYYEYLIQYFGPEITNRHKIVFVAGVGHSANGMFNSACGSRYLFDYDPSGQCDDRNP